jgi:hypothetical protein
MMRNKYDFSKAKRNPLAPRFSEAEIDKQLNRLKLMKDEDIDFSDIPEITDWRDAVRGKFYRPSLKFVTLRIMNGNTVVSEEIRWINRAKVQVPPDAVVPATKRRTQPLMKAVMPQVTTNIKRKWFAPIVALRRTKDVEYRDIGPYWDARLRNLVGKEFNLRLLNGMLPPVPEALIRVKKLVRNSRAGQYEIHLGSVLKLKHWDRKKGVPS